jgi:glycerol-3-phosphate dehydrogenase
MVIPFEPDRSHFYLHLTGLIEPRMPLSRDPLDDQVIRFLRRWIEEGARDDLGNIMYSALIADLRSRFPFLDERWARRLVRDYGTEARAILAGAASAEALGERFGWDLTEREVRWLIAREWARTAEDVLWRRTKLGLRLSPAEVQRLDDWMRAETGTAVAAAASS